MQKPYIVFFSSEDTYGSFVGSNTSFSIDKTNEILGQIISIGGCDESRNVVFIFNNIDRSGYNTVIHNQYQYGFC